MITLLLAVAIELARVNGEVITDSDLKAAFVGKHGGHTVFLGGDTETRRFLDIVINERLLVQEAYNLGLDEDPAVKAPVEEFRLQKLSDRLLKMELQDKATPSQEEIRAAWEEARNLYLAREIVLDTREEAEAVRRAILSGADFETIARACSIVATRSRGGALPPFTWGSLSVEVEEAARKLEPGEMSAVFRTEDGWRILYLVDRADATRPALDDKVSARIAAKLTERKREALSEAFSAALWRKYDATVSLPDRSPAAMARLLVAAPETVIATWRGGQLKAKEAFTPGELRMYSSMRAGRAAEKVESTLRAAVNTALVKLEARERKIDEIPEVAQEIDRYEARLMESALYSKHVLTGVKVTDDDVRADWERKKAQFTVKEKRRVAHIAVPTQPEADALLARLRKGEQWDELLEKHTLDKQSIKTKGDLGWIEKGKVSEKYDPLFSLALNGVSKPIQSEVAWHLVRVTEIAPEHVLSFEEAKETARKNLLEKKKHDAREFWIGKLRQASEIKILDDGVKEFVKANPYTDPEVKAEPKAADGAPARPPAPH